MILQNTGGTITPMTSCNVPQDFRIMGPQYQLPTCYLPGTWNLEVAPRLLGIVVDPWLPSVLHG